MKTITPPTPTPQTASALFLDEQRDPYKGLNLHLKSHIQALKAQE